MAERVLGSVTVVKTPEMDLTTRDGRVAFLATVVAKIDPLVDLHYAEEVADTVLEEVTLAPAGEGDADRLFAEFVALPAGALAAFGVQESFLTALADYVSVLDWLEGEGELVVRRGPPSPEDACWRPVLVPGGGATLAERVAFAMRLIAEGQERDMRWRAEGREPPPRRYEPGAAYGALLFVSHPFSGSLDDQLWLTADGSLWWLNERDCSIEAFRHAVVRAAPLVAVAVVVSGVSAATAVALAAAPVLAVAGRAMVDAGYGVAVWTLANPITARQLFFAGVELSLAVGFNEDLPPISPADQLEFAVAGAVGGGTHAAVRYVTEVVAALPAPPIAQATSRAVSVRLVVREMSVLVGQAATTLLGRSRRVVHVAAVSAAQMGANLGLGVAPPPTARPLLSPRAISWLTRVGFTAAQITRVGRARGKNHLLVRAANRFAGPYGFNRVLSEAVSGHRNKEQGARFVIEYAMSLVPERELLEKALYFEMRVGVGEEQRYVDLFFDGVRYELKSVRDVASYLVIGSKGKFGQFQKDIVRLLGTTEETAFQNLGRFRWVFDSTKLGPGQDRRWILGQMREWLATNPPFDTYPRLQELLAALDDVVVTFP